MGYVWVDDDTDDDDDTSTSSNTGKNDLPGAARKHMRAVEKERDAFKRELEQLKAQARKASVADILKAQGYDPKIASFVPAEADGQEAVEKWLSENGGMFVKAASSNDDTASQTQGSALPPELEQALSAVTRVTADATSPTRLQNMGALINAANSPEELTKLLQLASGRS